MSDVTSADTEVNVEEALCANIKTVLRCVVSRIQRIQKLEPEPMTTGL